jgi:hypothetical protein
MASTEQELPFMIDPLGMTWNPMNTRFVCMNIMTVNSKRAYFWAVASRNEIRSIK